MIVVTTFVVVVIVQLLLLSSVTSAFLLVPTTRSTATTLTTFPNSHRAFQIHNNRLKVRCSVSLLPQQQQEDDNDNRIMSLGERRVAARQWVNQGMDQFRRGMVLESIASFDQAEAVFPSISPFLWQRGLSYYYANQFDKASRQFRTDVQVNPVDVEEIVWDIASQLRQSTNSIFPIPNALSLPFGRQDSRPIMMVVYKLFRGEGSEQDLAVAGHSRSIRDEFYALFYLGLFAEARGEVTKAAAYMKQAKESEYATSMVGRNDYMVACARVQCQLRGWN